MNVSERCGCGATIDLAGEQLAVASAVSDWREGYRHIEPEPEPHRETDVYSTAERAEPYQRIGFTAPGLEPEPLEEA